MYEPHPVFKPPTNPKVTIWRYLSFTKFVSLLDARSLYFARADQMEDPLEGRWSSPTAQAVQEYAAELSKSPSRSEQERENIATLPGQLADLARQTRSFTFINAWHVGEHESAAMWKMYSEEKEGVAIVSTYDNLIGSLGADEEHRIHVGIVNYIDFEKTAVPVGNAFTPFMFKRKSFEFENELRAVVLSRSLRAEPGIQMKVDLNQLIVRVQVSPKTKGWFEDLVRSVAERYGCERPVNRSKLYDDPLA